MFPDKFRKMILKNPGSAPNILFSTPPPRFFMEVYFNKNSNDINFGLRGNMEFISTAYNEQSSLASLALQ